MAVDLDACFEAYIYVVQAAKGCYYMKPEQQNQNQRESGLRKFPVISAGDAGVARPPHTKSNISSLFTFIMVLLLQF